MDYYPKAFIKTAEGLVFAVVSGELEDGKVLCFLRYQQMSSGWQKLDTAQANALLTTYYPYYQYYSSSKDAHCHAVPVTHITQHFQPRQQLQQLLQTQTADPVLRDCIYFVELLRQGGVDGQRVGITGSLLIGAQRASSDIDLVIYDRLHFARARQWVRDLIAQGQLQALTEQDWREAYTRRACALSFEEYVWHERRKYNKVMINGRKVDLGLLSLEPVAETQIFQKTGRLTRQCKVVDDALAYDYPAEFMVDAEDFERVVCFTATYTGQATVGEWIEVAGQVEATGEGARRIVVGSSREAQGEYIKVIPAHV